MDEEEPDRSAIVGVTKVVNVDGTDTKVEKCRGDHTAAALGYGSKNQEIGARSLNWCTATSLSFEHTNEYLARVSEKALYEHHGSLGKRKAPVKDWKGIAEGLSKKQKICKLETAVDYMFDYHDIEETFDTIKALKIDEKLVAGAVDDGVLLTATLAEVEEMPGVKAKQSTLPPTLTEQRIPTVDDIDNWAIEREAIKTVQKTSTKIAPLIELETIKQQNKLALEGGVNSSGVEKLAQYETHERLHRAYEEKKLKRTILAYFLYATKEDRWKLLKWMGSDMAPPSVPMPSEDDLPVIWLRLAKIPAEYEILGDKGFYKGDRMNPFVNHIRTPWKLSDKKVQQYRRSAGMIIEDRETSDTRVVVEDDYERYRNERILKGTVPYWVLAMLPYAHEWGHAMMNLAEPMRRPGKNSAVANIRGYWDKHEDKN